MIRLLRTCTISLLLLWVIAPALAQETADPPTTPPGFDIPDDVTDIDQYRLPSWSFTTVLLNLSGGGRRRSLALDSDIAGSPDRDVNNFSLNLNLAPSLETFTESEDRRFRLDVDPVLRVGGSGVSDEEGGEQIFEEDQRAVVTSLNVSTDWTEYVAGDVFLRARTDNFARYDRVSTETTDRGTRVQDEVDLAVVYESRARLGVGFGRLRDVTPVIRALRVQERLQELGRENVLSSDNIQAAAQQFARRPGYAPVYDRGDKYFWNDFFSGIEAQSSELLAYESFYLAESLVEQVARRQEGYEVSAGIDLDYLNRLNKENQASGFDERRRSINSTVGFFAEGRYATNTSLRQQITVFGDVSYGIPTQEDASIEGVLQASVGGRHLWEIADRYQLITSATAQHRRQKPETGDAVTDVDLLASSNFAVFVENNVRLNAGLNYNYSLSTTDFANSQRTTNEIRFSFGVNYFLFRGLK